MTAISNIIWRNPVLYRELKQRMSNARVMIILSVYLLVLGAIVFALYRARTGDRLGGFGQPDVTRIADIGQSLFEWVLFFMLLLVLFIVPGLTAASIAGERERQTLLPLQVSLLKPRSIILGKVGASLAFTVLLLIASLPLLAVAYLVGGITIREVFIGLGMVLFTAFALACITVALSTLVKRVQGAIVLSYGLVLLLVGGTIIAFLVIGEFRGDDFGRSNAPIEILAANPIAVIADVTDSGPQVVNQEVFFEFGPAFSSGSVDSPLSAMRELMNETSNGGFGGPFPAGFDNFGNPIFPGGANADADRWLPFWAKNMVFMSALALISLVVASRRIRTPAKTER